MMRTHKKQIAIIAQLCLLLITASLLVNCGGSSEMAQANPPAPPSSTPPPAGGGGTAGGGTGGGGTGGGTTTSQDFYLASLFPVVEMGMDEPQMVSTAHRGTIQVNEAASNGLGIIQMTGGDPNSGHQLRFCQRGAPRAFSNCISLLDYSTDASGNATLNFQMPAGNYSGAFYVFKGSEVKLAGGFNTSRAETSFATGLSPSPGTAGGGRGEVTGRTAKVSINGGPANETFRCQLLNITRGSADLGNLVTDAQGNGTNDPTVFAARDNHPYAWTGTFYCSAKCETGTCQYSYSTTFKDNFVDTSSFHPRKKFFAL